MSLPLETKLGQSHDKWWSSKTTTSHEDLPLGQGNMDHNPQDNQSSEDNNYQPQYHWLSPPNPVDNPISGIDSELFAESIIVDCDSRHWVVDSYFDCGVVVFVVSSG